MNIQTLCLAILYDKDATGYEIRKLSTQGKYAYFVEASFGSIYPALNKLERGGYVTSRYEAHSGTPAKKIYSITDAGRSKFYNSLFDELNDDVFRSEFLLFARFVSLLPAALVKKRLNERIQSLKNQQEALKAILNSTKQEADKWVINYGLNVLDIEIDYLKNNMSHLIALAVQNDDDDKPISE